MNSCSRKTTAFASPRAGDCFPTMFFRRSLRLVSGVDRSEDFYHQDTRTRSHRKRLPMKSFVNLRALRGFLGFFSCEAWPENERIIGIGYLALAPEEHRR